MHFKPQRRISRLLLDLEKHAVSTARENFQIMLRWRKPPCNSHRCHKFFF